MITPLDVADASLLHIPMLAMLAAPGTSYMRNVYVINRGYEELAERLNALGASVQPFRDIG